MKPHPYLLAPALALACLAGLVLAVAVTREARGHPPHRWIQAEPGYVAPWGAHCCSTDCVPDDASKFTVDRGGITYEGQRLEYGKPGIYQSADPAAADGEQKWWRCKVGLVLYCIFRPAHAGS